MPRYGVGSLDCTAPRLTGFEPARFSGRKYIAPGCSSDSATVLTAQRFDSEPRQLLADPVTVAPGVARIRRLTGLFSRPPPRHAWRSVDPTETLVWVKRSGEARCLLTNRPDPTSNYPEFLRTASASILRADRLVRGASGFWTAPVPRRSLSPGGSVVQSGAPEGKRGHHVQSRRRPTISFKGLPTALGTENFFHSPKTSVRLRGRRMGVHPLYSAQNNNDLRCCR